MAPADRDKARAALAATAAWSAGELDLTLRVALVPMTEIRKQRLDVRVARYGPSENLSYAMFSGGGLAWADAAVKRGEFAVTPAPPGTWPDLTGLSCRFEQFPAARGLILSLLILPFVGFGLMQQMAPSNTILQTIVEDDKRGRVMAFYSMAFLGMVPFGSLLAGSVADRFGAPRAVMLNGLVCLAASVLFARKLPEIRTVKTTRSDSATVTMRWLEIVNV